MLSINSSNSKRKKLNQTWYERKDTLTKGFNENKKNKFKFCQNVQQRSQIFKCDV